MKNKKALIILLILAVIIIVGILFINNKKENKNEEQKEVTGKVVENTLTGMYEVYDSNGSFVTTLQDESMKSIYESNPYYDPNPTR